MQMELGWCDLYSMQPCDSHFYPYMQLVKPSSELEELEYSLREYFEAVKGHDSDDEEDEDD